MPKKLDLTELYTIENKKKVEVNCFETSVGCRV